MESPQGLLRPECIVSSGFPRSANPRCRVTTTGAAVVCRILAGAALVFLENPLGPFHLTVPQG